MGGNHELPSDPSVPLAVNQGTPAVLSDGGCDFSKAIAALAKVVVPPPGASKQAKRRLSLARS